MYRYALPKSFESFQYVCAHTYTYLLMRLPALGKNH